MVLHKIRDNFPSFMRKTTKRRGFRHYRVSDTTSDKIIGRAQLVAFGFHGAVVVVEEAEVLEDSGGFEVGIASKYPSHHLYRLFDYDHFPQNIPPIPQLTVQLPHRLPPHTKIIPFPRVNDYLIPFFRLNEFLAKGRFVDNLLGVVDQFET